MKRFAAYLLASGTFLLASAAGAAEPSTFWIEAHPWTCSKHLAPFARELTLACDAAGASCSVATSEASADRRILLRCDDAKWTVEADDKNGARAWTVDITGEPEGRARSAAVFVVRAETGERLPPAPPPPSAAEPPREPAPVAAKVDPRAPASADKSADDDSKKVPDVTFAFGSRASVKLADVTNSSYDASTQDGGKIFGVNGAATVDIEGVRFGPTAGVGFGVDYVDSWRAEKSAPFFWNVGAVTALGAPFKRKMFGLAFEGGFGRIVLDRAVHDFGYVRPSFVVQPLPKSQVRPFFAGAYELKGGKITGHMASLDIGMAWDL